MTEYTSGQTLIYLNIAAIIIHLFSGSLGIYFIQDGNPKVNTIASLFEYIITPIEIGPYFIPTPKTIFSIPILTPLVAVEFITAFFHCIYLLAILFPNVDFYIRSNIINTPSKNPLRWIEYAITATMLASFGNLAMGITDFYVFIRNISCGITLQGLGYLIEILTPLKGTSFPTDLFYKNLYYFQGLLNNLPFVGILLYQTFASNTHDNQRLFIENSIPLAIWFNTFGVICQLSYNEWRQFSDIKFSEKWYILLSLSTKVTIFWVEFATFKKIVEDNGAVAKSNVNWEAVRYISLSLPAFSVILMAWLDYQNWKHPMQKNTKTAWSITKLFY